MSIHLSIVLFHALMAMSILPMHETRAADNCSNMDMCPLKNEVKYIHILFPGSGSHLHMSECRVHYIVENAPAGAFSRIFIGIDEVVFFRIGERQTQFFDQRVDEKLVLYPGIWELKVTIMMHNVVLIRFLVWPMLSRYYSKIKIRLRLTNLLSPSRS